jgi:nucleoside transporter
MARPIEPKLAWSLRWRLSALWLLQFAIWGSWFTYAPRYLEISDISELQRGLLFASMGIALWLAPLVAGQVADRWLATQHALALCHAVGALLLWCLASVKSFGGMLLLAPLYAMVYVPTWALASSLTFRHLPDRDRQFGAVRLWGTVGWVGAGWMFGLWLGWGDYLIPAEGRITQLLGAIAPQDSDCFRQAAIFSLLLSALCLRLPHTPPRRRSGGGVAPLAVLEMLREPSFAFFALVCLLLATALPVYFLTIAPFLHDLGVADHWLTPVQTLGQASEVPTLLLLPLALRYLGFKKTFTVGVAAWALRFLIFSLGEPHWLVIASIALHGVCHVFILITAQLYVDARCPRDVRASAQNFLGVIAFGIGLPIGYVLAGLLTSYYTSENVTDYRHVYLVSTLTIAALLAAFWLFFREPDRAVEQRMIEEQLVPGVDTEIS